MLIFIFDHPSNNYFTTAESVEEENLLSYLKGLIMRVIGVIFR